VFKHILTILLVASVLSCGCQGVAPNDPTNVPEKVVPYNVTLDQMKADLVGHWVTLDSNKRWTFTRDEEISLALIDEPDEVDARTVVSNVRVMSKPTATPNVYLCGFMKIRYEMVDGHWYLTEVLALGGLNEFQKK